MPYCPKCRDEFQDWVKVCPDCGEKLVEKLEPVSEPPVTQSGYYKNPEELVTVASVSTYTEAQVIAAKLESDGIPSYVPGGILFGNGSSIPGVYNVKVREPDAARALKLITEQNETDDNDELFDEVT